MTNPYYNFDDPAIPGAVVDGLAYNLEMQKVTEAFDAFPPAISFTSGSFNYGEQNEGDLANTYTSTVAAIPLGTSYTPGNNVAIRVNATNSGQSTLNVSEGGALPVWMGSATDTVANDLKAGGVYTFAYDGTRWRTLEMSTRFFGVAESQVAAAQASEVAAVASAGTASTQAGNASASEATAAAQVAPATASASSAAGSASTAATQASNAGASASAAADSANLAGQRATAATGSASAAATSAGTAATQAGNATTSAGTAATQAGNATSSAMDAATANTTAQGITSAPDFNDRVTAAILELELVVNSVELFAAADDPNTIYPGTTWVKLPELCTLLTNDGDDPLGIVGEDTVTLTENELGPHTHVVPVATTSDTAITATIAASTIGSLSASAANIQKTTSEAGALVATVGSYTPPLLNTNSTGGHTHTFNGINTQGAGATSQIRTVAPPTTAGAFTTSAAATHSHTFALPLHSHQVVVPDHAHSVVLPVHNHSFDLPPHLHTVTPGAHGHGATLAIDSQGSGTSFSVVNSNIKLIAWYRTA